MLAALAEEEPPEPLLTAGLSQNGTSQNGTLDLARTIHARRALEQALDHGTALLAALGLPPLRSMTRAMALLDAIDAPGEDREDGPDDEPDSDGEDDGTAEPLLGAPEKDPACGYGLGISRDGRPYQSQAHWADGSRLDADREVEDEHGGDVLDSGEETLGWAANVSQLGLGQNTADGDTTAPERHGRGFVRCGADDLEDGDVDDDGRFPWPDGAPAELITEERHA